jgi:hypothetical protein
MNPYTLFDITRVNQLTVIKNGVFCPDFQLTDGANIYGKLYFKSWFKKTGYIDTANGNWIVKKKGTFCNDVLLIDTMGNLVATTKTNVWKGNVTLNFPDNTSLKFKCNGWFSKIRSWYSEAYGNLLNIDMKIFSNKTPFIISFDPAIAKITLNPLLLAFMGINVILIRRTQAAAAIS